MGQCSEAGSWLRFCHLPHLFTNYDRNQLQNISDIDICNEQEWPPAAHGHCRAQSTNKVMMMTQGTNRRADVVGMLPADEQMRKIRYVPAFQKFWRKTESC
jgi:hypothetical protein